ncbi:elongation factor [Hygrophoropsis aurantiaca]|uniref:Elongation factor n=1 Tax=Hygrophoropsis aurantiaca TaxID=72124 RepID=A0ACB7ZYQ1_9AGAM|nr:elongation factor [Hygrophoropsis aurantiaca]
MRSQWLSSRLHLEDGSYFDPGRFYAVSRVLSGTIHPGQEVHIWNPNYTPGKKEGLFVKAVGRVVVMNALESQLEPIDHCSASNIVGLLGIDQYLLHSGTLTASETTHNVRNMNSPVSPVVQVAVSVLNPADLPKLVEGLKQRCKSDLCVQTWSAATGEYIVAGAGELHLKMCLKDLQDSYAGVPLNISSPTVGYRETVRAESSIVALSMSQNRLNRIYAKALLMDETLIRVIASRSPGFNTGGDTQARARILVHEHAWDATHARTKNMVFRSGYGWP